MRARIVPDNLAFTADLDGALKIVDFRPQYQGGFTVSEKPRAKGEVVSDPIRIAGKPSFPTSACVFPNTGWKRDLPPIPMW